MAPRIFISYAQPDQDLADDLSARLRLISDDIILVTPKLKPGQVWSAALLSQLKQANEILVLLTPNSIDDWRVLLEVGAGTGLEKPVVPIIVGLDAATLPGWVRGLHFVKYSELTTHLPDLVVRAGLDLGPLAGVAAKSGI
jgi:hypothetical protein